jgi:tripeptide aminopeptidase
MPFTSALAETLAPDVLDRFLRYVRVDTQSARDAGTTPSTPGQLELARLLQQELNEIGLEKVSIDEHGNVTATLPGNTPHPAPTIGLLAHLDTSPDAPGAGVEPLVHRAYDGGTITLPRNGTVLAPDAMPNLASKRGHDIVTSSGDTLLGADDKAGVAEIMAAVAHLAAHPELPRPTVKVAFTPDEEIGSAHMPFDIERFGARCAYTLDGSRPGELQDETFSAAAITIRIRGVEVHPGLAKGTMVNALKLAARIVAELPRDGLSPETTEDREGFVHPHELTADATQAEISLIARDFDDDRLAEHVALVRELAEGVVAAEPRARLEFVAEDQYRNMRRAIEKVPEAVATAERAIRAEGIEPLRTPIRGGTDGSRLSAMGLPTPNLFTGGDEYHSVREWASLQDMAASAATIVRLAGEWAAR